YPNDAPEFRDASNQRLDTVSVYLTAGNLLEFDLTAVDTNTRFDSVFIYANTAGEVFDAATVISPAQLVAVEGSRSASTQLVWQTYCDDVRPGVPYIIEIIARDNQCVFPAADTLRMYVYVEQSI